MARGAPVTTISESTTNPQLRPKGAPVRHFRAIPFLIATAAVTAVVAGTALAATQTKVAFKGTYIGKVTEKVDGSNVTASANGAGKGTAIGVGKLSGVVKGTTANPPCSRSSAPGRSRD